MVPGGFLLPLLLFSSRLLSSALAGCFEFTCQRSMRCAVIPRAPLRTIAPFGPFVADGGPSYAFGRSEFLLKLFFPFPKNNSVSDFSSLRFLDTWRPFDSLLFLGGRLSTILALPSIQVLPPPLEVFSGMKSGFHSAIVRPLPFRSLSLAESPSQRGCALGVFLLGFRGVSARITEQSR